MISQSNLNKVKIFQGHILVIETNSLYLHQQLYINLALLQCNIKIRQTIHRDGKIIITSCAEISDSLRIVKLILYIYIS